MHDSFRIKLTAAMPSGSDDDTSTGAPGCVKATPDSRGHVPADACNSYYNFDPATAPAVAVAVIFAILTTVHVVEAVTFKKVRTLPSSTPSHP